MIVVLDVNFIIAFLYKKDKNHLGIAAHVEKLRQENPTILFVVTNFILSETLTRMEHTLKIPKDLVVGILESIANDPSIKIEIVDEPLFNKALNYYRSFRDKHWSVVDFTTYAYMKEKNLNTVATIGHKDAVQFGFRLIPSP